MAACTVQLSGDMSSALSATASLAHFAGSSFLPLVDSPACCAAAAQHSDSGLTLPTLSPPAATLLQAHACAPVPVRNPMHRVSRQSKRHRDVSGTLVVPTAESGGFSCDHVHIHGAPRSHSPGAVSRVLRTATADESALDNSIGMHVLHAKAGAGAALSRSQTMMDLCALHNTSETVSADSVDG